MERQYEYKPKVTRVLFGVAFFIGIILFLCFMQRGKAPGPAAIFDWLRVGLIAVLFIYGVAFAIWRLSNGHRIVITRDSILIPRSDWSREELKVPFRDIVELTSYRARGDWFLNIIYDRGKFQLHGAMLPSEEVFAEIYEFLYLGYEASHAESTAGDLD